MKPLLLTNARVFREDRSKAEQGDLFISESGYSLGKGLAVPEEGRVIDLSGLCVSPGWVDFHTHLFGSFGIFSVPPEKIGRGGGVTTLVDAGSSGALNFRTFFECAVKPAQEKILGYINVSNAGILHGHAGRPGFIGDHCSASFHNTGASLALLDGPDAWKECIVGWKARLSAVLADNNAGRERQVVDRLLELRDASGLPVMVHHVKSTYPTDKLLQRLRERDVYTHLYHGYEDSLFDASTGEPSVAAREARARGVVFDVGHGSGAFSWECAEKACREFDFWPDIISSDLHRFNVFWPVVDLATTMSKFLYLGASEEDVVAMVTGNAGRALGRDIGSLVSGGVPNLTVFAVEEGHFPLWDSRGGERMARKRFVPLAVIVGGEICSCTAYGTMAPLYPSFMQTIQDASVD